jgi:hypothetical protein
MKNITLSLPDDLLEKSRAYAQKRGTTLNALVRLLLREKVERENQFMLATLFEEMDALTLGPAKPWTREELYER